MNQRDAYLEQISRRGDAYGGRNGLLDLLNWCEKMRLPDVTEEEARIYLESPNAIYHTAVKQPRKG